MRDPAQHPSRRQIPTAAAGLELDLSPPTTPARPTGARQEQAQPSAAPQAIAVPELQTTAPAPEIQVGAPVSQAVAPAAPAPSFDGDRLDVGLAEDPEEAKPRPIPTVSSSLVEADKASGPDEPNMPGAPPPSEVDPHEVRLLANYPPQPSSPLGSVAYAWRVHKRRRELQAMYETHRQAHDDLSRQVQEDIASIVDGLRAVQGEDESQEMTDVFAEIERSESLIRERAMQMHETTEAFNRQNHALDEDLDARNADRRKLEEELQTVQIRFESCVEEQRKVTVVQKRLKQKLQGQHELAREDAGEGAQFATPAHARQLLALQKELEACEAELAQRDQAVREATDAVRIQRRAIAEIGRRMDAILVRRRGLGEEADRAESLHNEGVTQAKQHRLDACERVLWASLESETPMFDPEQQGYARKLDASRHQSAVELERHRLAIGDYDLATFRRGIVVACGSVVLVLVLLLTLVRLV